MDNFKVRVHYADLEDQAWDFGDPDSSPVHLPSISLDKLHPNATMLWDNSLSAVKDKATAKVIFWLSKKYGKPVDVQWNSEYLVACFISGEVLILDFSCVLL